ncbi:TRAP transporter large permease [Elioraea rosea]|uniref:TRAP transporter large permease n=1 Tax=Elioraea rosea TaxID=2492390 RepID=UPI0011839C28|nr:TRAP transporter large permease subunit [Elioraea rosea]
MLETYELLVIILLASFILLIFTGYPIAWVLAGVSFWFVVIAIYGSEYADLDTYLLTSWARFSVIVDRIWSQMQNSVLVALPMFVFMGLMLDRSGVADRLMQSFTRLFGSLQGGLAIAVCCIGILLAASTGIVGASVVLLATLSMPLMLAYSYSKRLAAGVIAASGTLGILIPPSIMLVIMADQLAMSVGDLFMGAMIPGLLLGVLYMLYVIVVTHLFPGMGPPPADAPPMTARIVLDALLSMAAPAALILAVLGTIFFGIATATEASGVGAFGAMLLAAWNRRLDWRCIKDVSYETAATTAFIMAIFLGASAFALVMRNLGGDEFIAHMLRSLPFGPEGIIIVILGIAFVAGFFLDWLEISLIFLPLVAPVVKALGFDPVWFVVVFAVMLQTSFLTPPVGFSLFYLKGVVPKEVSTRDIYLGILPFVAIQLLCVFLVFEFPELALWLPREVYGGAAR